MASYATIAGEVVHAMCNSNRVSSYISFFVVLYKHVVGGCSQVEFSQSKCPLSLKYIVLH